MNPGGDLLSAAIGDTPPDLARQRVLHRQQDDSGEQEHGHVDPRQNQGEEIA